MSILRNNLAQHKLISFAPSDLGKEIDIRQFFPHFQITGLRVVVSAKNIRFLCRLTFNGKKLSKSLGSCSYPEFAQQAESKLVMVKSYHLKAAQNLHPFDDNLQSIQVMSFAHFVQNIYLPHVQNRKKSYKDDESRARIHLIPILGHLTFNQMTIGRLNQLFTDIRSKDLTDATVNRIRALLSSIFSLAIDHELIDANPINRVKKFKENNQKERYFVNDELQRLMKILNFPKQYGISNLVIVAAVKFLLLTGVRKREALDLKWSDLDLNSGRWLLGENKSGKARYINLNKDAVSLIQQLSATTDYVFANPETGKPFNDIRKTFNKIMQISDIKEIRIHDLRHNFASLAVNSGQSLYVVQHLLGHASPQTTQRYAHLQANTLKQASEAVASVIRDQTNHVRQVRS